MPAPRDHDPVFCLGIGIGTVLLIREKNQEIQFGRGFSARDAGAAPAPRVSVLPASLSGEPALADRWDVLASERLHASLSPGCKHG